MTNTKVISVLAIVAVAAMMGAASIAPAYAGVSYAKNADRAPFEDRAGGLDITGTCVAQVDRNGDLHILMIGQGFEPGQTVKFGTNTGGILGEGTANPAGVVNSGDIVIENYNGPAEFQCRIGIQGHQEASADIDLSD